MTQLAHTAVRPAGRGLVRRPILLRLLDALVAWDARQRQAHKLRSLPKHRLDDMGLSQRDAETAFRR